MRHLPMTLILCAAALPAAAQDVCEDLWFTRNLIFDRAGYCFSSNLGRAIFDNAGCIGNDVEPDPAEQWIVDAILAREALLDCDVDTTARSLDFPDIEVRRAMIDLPIRDEFGSGCIGWRGAPIALHTARDAGAPVIGWIGPGEDIYFGFDQIDGWDFVINSTDPAQMGWMPAFIWNEKACDGFAG